MRTIEPIPGDLLYDSLTEAVALANEHGEMVAFDFNGERFVAEPGDTFEQAKGLAEAKHGHPIRSRDEMAEDARLSLERTKAERDAAIAEAGVPDEKGLREAEVPWPKSRDELLAYIDGLVDRPHDYGTCVYAMSMAAVAALYYVSGQLGVTGFQASCADMDILRRTRGLKGGFRIVNYEDLLYPQHWDSERRGVFEAALRENPEHYRERARDLLADSTHAHPNARAHWERLATEATS